MFQQGWIKSVVPEGKFGFIRPENGGSDIYFNARSLANVKLNDVKCGQACTYDTELGPKGMRAVRIHV